MNTASTSNVDITKCNSYGCNTLYCSTIYSHDLYGDWLNSLSEVKEKNVLMHHLPSDIRIASALFPSYLTDEELQETQYKGRFWDVIDYDLYILVDNETLVVVNLGNVKTLGRDYLPYSLRGRYYYDEC